MQLDPYLALSKEAYDDLIRAAGLKAGAVAKVCNDKGIWGSEAQADAPPNAVEEPLQQYEGPSEEHAHSTGADPVTESPPEEPPSDIME